MAVAWRADRNGCLVLPEAFVGAGLRGVDRYCATLLTGICILFLRTGAAVPSKNKILESESAIF